MKKNIFIGVLIVVTLMSILYAYVQQAEAVKQRQFAEQERQRAEEARAQVEECQRTAQSLQQAIGHALASTESQKALAENALKESKK